jgi:hypothetical protein
MDDAMFSPDKRKRIAARRGERLYRLLGDPAAAVFVFFAAAARTRLVAPDLW